MQGPVDFVGRSVQKARSRSVGVGLNNEYAVLSGGETEGGASAQAELDIKANNIAAIRFENAAIFKINPHLTLLYRE
jgi:hypothetical protein